MSYSHTTTESTTFTITHAKHIASKVVSDLMRVSRLYGGEPSLARINDYEKELVQFLKNGYVEKVTYGFKRNDQWIEPTLIYTASDLNSFANDDPGKIRPGKDITGAHFASYMSYTDKWFDLSDLERSKFEEELPFSRSVAEYSKINGYIESDKNYSSGGVTMNRSSVRSY